MKRRRFALFVAALALAAAQPSLAQPAGKVFRVGWIAFSEPTTPEARAVFGAFFDALRENGFVDGKNVRRGAQVRWAESGTIRGCGR